MIVILSSAKTLDLEPCDLKLCTSEPQFEKEAAGINSRLRVLDQKKISALMEISPKLSAQVCSFVENFTRPVIKKPAILIYSGVVYRQLNIEKYKTADFEFADRTLRTISGLYGVLRPLDLVAPYRLEMGAGLQLQGGQTLTSYWRDKVTRAVKKDILKTKAKCLLNLASKEYSQVIDPAKINVPFINIDFKERKGAQLKTVGLLAKVARGKMANYIIEKRVQDPRLLKKYKLDGYSFNAELSDEENFVFVR